MKPFFSREWFIAEAELKAKQNPQWRKGQAYYNTLAMYARDAADEIANTHVDPHQHDDRIGIFLDAVFS